MMSKREYVIACGVSEDCKEITHLFVENPESLIEINAEAKEVIGFANKLLIVNYQKKKITKSKGTWMNYRCYDSILFGLFPFKYPDEIAERFLVELSDSLKEFMEDGDEGHLKFSSYSLMNKYSNTSQVRKEMKGTNLSQNSNIELNKMLDSQEDLGSARGPRKENGIRRQDTKAPQSQNGSPKANSNTQFTKIVALIIAGALIVTLLIALIVLV